jgi:hypothetical protein
VILTSGMAHPRKLVRHAVRDLLVGATAAGSRVTATKVTTHKKTELPAISVYTLTDPVRDGSAETSPRELTHDPDVEVAIWVKVDPDAIDPGDAIDDICEQVEIAMDASRFLGGAAGDSVLAGTEIRPDPDGDPLVFIATLTYSVTYRASPAALTLDDFLRAKATHQIVGAGSDNTVSDDFVVQETP